MTKWSMRFACWIPKATNTHSEYVILISFPLQQWLHARASMSRYTYSAYCVNNVPKLCKNACRVAPCAICLDSDGGESSGSSPDLLTFS
jgi:hypothetical protein